MQVSITLGLGIYSKETSTVFFAVPLSYSNCTVIAKHISTRQVIRIQLLAIRIHAVRYSHT